MARRRALFDDLGLELPEITASVGTGGANRRGDNAKVQSLLSRAGQLDLARTGGPTGYGMMTLENGIERFQRDQGLKVDGRVDPGGPTIQKLAEAARLGPRRVSVIARPSTAHAPARRFIRGAGTRLVSGQQVIEPAPPPPAPTMSKIGRSPRNGRSDPNPPVARSGSGVTQAQAGPTPASSAPKYRTRQFPVPEYRKYVFSSDAKAKDWSAWQTTVGNLPNIRSGELRAYVEIFAAEGGRPIANNSPRNAGIGSETLSNLHTQGRLTAVAQGVPPRNLSLPQIANVYRDYQDDALARAGGSKVLGTIGDDRVAAALADTLFRHGATGGGNLIRRAINSIAPGAVADRGVMTLDAVDAYRKLTQRDWRTLLNRLAIERSKAVVGSPDIVGELTRIQHFTFQEARPVGSL